MSRSLRRLLAIGLSLATATTIGPVLTAMAQDEDGGLGALSRIHHFVIIYEENHSFDNLYGQFAGANGLANAGATQTQIDMATGLPYTCLPQNDSHLTSPPLPAGFCFANQPFDITQYVAANQKTRDLVHRYYQEQQQIDGGRMDKFVTVSDAKGLSLGYYPTSSLPVVQLINSMPDQATVMDHFFHAAFGGSFLNHQWLISAQTPVFPNA